MKKTLKTMAMLFFVVSMTALTSCTKSNEKLIIGKWKPDAISATYNGQTIELTLAQLATFFEADIEDLVVEFKDDGYVYAEGEKMSLYHVDDNILTITVEGETRTIDIVELTSKDLWLGMYDPESESYTTVKFVKV